MQQQTETLPFHLTDDQQQIRAMVRDFARTRIEPHVAHWDRERIFDRDLYRELGELGLMGACVPTQLGGAGLDFLSYILAIEELSRADAGVGVTVAVHTSAATLPIVAFGSQAQQEQFVPPLASGERIGAFALTEPDSGSDAGAMRTTAVDAGSAGFVVNGSKQWITNVAHAGCMILFARTEVDTRDARGVTAFITDPCDAAITIGPQTEKLGLHSSSTADLAIDGLQIPAEHLLGERAHGFRVAMATLDGGRIGIAAQAVGIAQACLDLASRYASKRNQFGAAIASFQATRFKLADMATEIAAARALTWQAAARKAAGMSHTVEGAQAKLFASATARRASEQTVQILGGYGYTTDFAAERYYRDAKITEIYEGTSEIQRIVIARGLLAPANQNR